MRKLRNFDGCICEPFGTVDKITVFDTNPNGIVVVKFKSANAADNVELQK